jgi:hypothetical protein
MISPGQSMMSRVTDTCSRRPMDLDVRTVVLEGDGMGLLIERVT